MRFSSAEIQGQALLDGAGLVLECVLSLAEGLVERGGKNAYRPGTRATVFK